MVIGTLEAVPDLWVTSTLQVILLTVTLFSPSLSSDVNTPLVCTDPAFESLCFIQEYIINICLVFVPKKINSRANSSPTTVCVPLAIYCHA